MAVSFLYAALGVLRYVLEIAAAVSFVYAVLRVLRHVLALQVAVGHHGSGRAQFQNSHPGPSLAEDQSGHMGSGGILPWP